MQVTIGTGGPIVMPVSNIAPLDRYAVIMRERHALERQLAIARVIRSAPDRQPRLERVRDWVISAGTTITGRTGAAAASR
jgi:hypothetical protein